MTEDNAPETVADYVMERITDIELLIRQMNSVLIAPRPRDGTCEDRPTLIGMHS